MPVRKDKKEQGGCKFRGTAESVLMDTRSSGEYVKRARGKLKLTQAQLAEQLGLERRSIMRFEQGDELPRQTRLAIRHLLSIRRKRHRKNNGDGDGDGQ
jgi:DNA-binding XRE family transcriptional regulator